MLCPRGGVTHTVHRIRLCLVVVRQIDMYAAADLRHTVPCTALHRIGKVTLFPSFHLLDFKVHADSAVCHLGNGCRQMQPGKICIVAAVLWHTCLWNNLIGLFHQTIFSTHMDSFYDSIHIFMSNCLSKCVPLAGAQRNMIGVLQKRIERIYGCTLFVFIITDLRARHTLGILDFHRIPLQQPIRKAWIRPAAVRHKYRILHTGKPLHELPIRLSIL